MLFRLFFCLSIFPQLSQAKITDFDINNLNLDYSSTTLNLFLLISVLSLVPSIFMMVTSFTRIVIILSFLRSAIGLQQSPPNSVMISLALFLSFYIMGPSFQAAYEEGVKPVIEKKMTQEEALPKIIKPFKLFMIKQTREKDLKLFLNIADEKPVDKKELIPLNVLVPAFMISELRRAFEIGFLIFLPFLIIDIVISAILMSMGMMMLPPVVISLPFKLIFFVIVDGWYMLCGSIVKSFQ